MATSINSNSFLDKAYNEVAKDMGGSGSASRNPSGQINTNNILANSGKGMSLNITVSKEGQQQSLS